MTRPTKRTMEQVLAALKGSRGIQTHIARRLDVSRPAVARYIKRWPEVAQAYDEECNTLLDQAEAKLFEKAIVDGSECSLHFLLATKGKQRGYSKRQEITGANAAPLTVVVTIGGRPPAPEDNT